MTRLHSTALISPSRAESNKPLKKAVTEKAVTAFLLPVHKERLEENLPSRSLLSARMAMPFLSRQSPMGFETASLWLGTVQSLQIAGVKRNVLLYNGKNSKALQMESMQHVSRSGEKGGPTHVGGK